MSEKGETGNNNNNNNNTCVVCYKNVEIYSIGMCDHPVCYECSTRMRVLCRQNECPICRQDLPKVVFINIIKPFRNIIKNNLLDTRFNIFFDNTNIQEKFIQLLSHTCQICKYKKLFGSFNGLKDHMRREHDLHYCELCVENLKIFSYERRCYTRSDLALHRRKGDADDKSHKGHPLCEFCECRYMDNDELFRHLRRDHLYCHFCDADGLHQYYDTYDYLRDHFSKEHYLCEEGPCANEKFTSVFRSDIDLKAHKSSVHGKFMGKAAAKQARTLELEFTLAPRGDNNRNNRRGQQSNNNNANPNSSNYNNNNNTNHNNNNNYNNNNNNNNASRNTRDYYDLQDNLPDNDLPSPASMKQPDVKSTQEFPSLGNTASSSSSSSGPVNFSQTKNKGRGGNLTIRGSFGSQKLSMNNENFPALGSDNSGLSNIVNLNLYSSNNNNNNNNNSNSGNSNSNNSNNNNNNNKTTSSVIQNATPNVSIHVNHKTNGSITTRVTRPTVKPVGQSSKKNDDFPALGGNCTSLKNTTHSTTTNTAQWTKVTCVKQPSVAVQKNNKKLNQQLTNLNDSMLSEAFPSLPKTSKDKKQTSISVTTNNTLKNIQKNDVPSSSSSTSSPSIKNTTINDDTNNNSKKKKKKKTKTTSTSNNNSSGNESLTSKTIQKNINDKQQSSDNNNNNTIDNNKNKTNDIVNIKDDSTKNLTRKRSEIKIDNLNNNNVKKNDDFPALGKSSKTSTTLKPPPGFGTLRLQQQQQQQQPAPPPGFPVKLNSIVRPQQQQQQQCNNDLTFTNSSGQSFTILPDKNNKIYTYLPPPDFQQRNKNLVSKISNILELKDAIDEFRLLSGLYRQNMCTAEDYYKRCRMEMGLSEFSIIFPEMLVLLPDINKQRELYYLHKKEINGQVKGLELCTLCGQVCKSESDIVSHLSSHTLENNFPALGAATATTTTGTTHSFNNNWPRKTA